LACGKFKGGEAAQTKNKTPAGSARIFVRSQAAAILPGCELPGFASLRQGSALPGSDARSAFAFTQTSRGRLLSKLKFKGGEAAQTKNKKTRVQKRSRPPATVLTYLAVCGKLDLQLNSEARYPPRRASHH